MPLLTSVGVPLPGTFNAPRPIFVVGPERRLYFGGAELALNSECSEVLIHLLEHAGAVIPEAALLTLLDDFSSRQRLMAIVCNVNAVLEQHSRLCGYVAHYEGQGYAVVMSSGTGPYLRFVAHFPPLIGRDRELIAIREKLGKSRFVTIVGAGGIGKTSVARVVCERGASFFLDGCYRLDLAPICDGKLLPVLLAASLGMQPVNVCAAADSRGSHFKAIADFLCGRHVLVVLDNCEHLLESAAAVAEELLAAGSGIHVLATSREPLRADGEVILRLAPMGLPSSSAATAAEALQSPAVQLFCRCAFADGVLLDSQAPVVAKLCRALDGLPLAIELAAALVERLGLESVANEAGRRLLDAARRPHQAKRRHLSLVATLDWSHELLTADERTVFARLSLFRGGFTLEAASAVAGDDLIDRVQAIDIVIGLVSKSLISVSTVGAEKMFCLLDTTREYASLHFAALDGKDPVFRSHARFLCKLLEQAHSDWSSMSRPTWLARYGSWLGDVRHALDWAFGDDGDKLLGVTLMSLSFPLADQVGAINEFGTRLDRALTALEEIDTAPAVVRMRLISFGRDVLHAPARANSQTEPILEEALRQMSLSGIQQYQGGPLSSLWAIAFTKGDYPVSLSAARRIEHVAIDADDPVLALVGMRTAAQSLHFLGRHEEAKALAMNALTNSWRRIPLSYTPCPVDISVSMRVLLARIYWMQGLFDQAGNMCDEALIIADGDRPDVLCQVLALAAIPLALWNGALELAQGHVEQLSKNAIRYSYGYWKTWAAGYHDVLGVMGGLTPAMPGRAALALSEKQLDHFPTFITTLPAEQTRARTEAGTVGWCTPEVLRVQAKHYLRQGLVSAVEAERLLRLSLNLGNQQGSLAWELRSASSLARLLLEQGRRGDAHEVLNSVLERFREGHGSAAIAAARALLYAC